MFDNIYLATAYTAGLAAYFLRLGQIGRLGPDANGNDPDLSPAGLKRYILNNGWQRYTDPLYGDVVGIWNGAAADHIQLQGICPYERSNLDQQIGFWRQGNYDDSLTGQCIPGTSPTGSPTSVSAHSSVETSSIQSTFQTSSKGPEPTGFECTENTADQCAPALICSAPRRNGCIDGKCVCILPDSTTSTANQTTLATTSGDTGTTGLSETSAANPTTLTTSNNTGPTSLPETSASGTTTQKPEPTKTPLRVGTQKCNSEDDFPDHGDVHGNDVIWSVVGVCKDKPLMMKPGDKWEQNRLGIMKGSKIHFRVKWIKDCVTEVGEQDMKNPLGTNGNIAAENVCVDLFYNNWKNCEYFTNDD